MIGILRRPPLNSVVPILALARGREPTARTARRYLRTQLVEFVLENWFATSRAFTASRASPPRASEFEGQRQKRRPDTGPCARIRTRCRSTVAGTFRNLRCRSSTCRPTIRSLKRCSESLRCSERTISSETTCEAISALGVRCPTRSNICSSVSSSFRRRVGPRPGLTLGFAQLILLRSMSQKLQ